MTNMTMAKLGRANLSRADLKLAKLNRADLTRANLSLAKLNQANLTGANLDGVIGADFSGALNVPDKYLKD